VEINKIMGIIADSFISKPGVYLTMNGKVFDPDEAVKNLDLGRFEDKDT